MYSRLLQDKVQVGSPLSQGLDVSGRVKVGRNVMSFTKSIGLDSDRSAYVLRSQEGTRNEVLKRRRWKTSTCLAGLQYLIGLELRMISRPAGVDEASASEAPSSGPTNCAATIGSFAK